VKLLTLTSCRPLEYGSRGDKMELKTISEVSKIHDVSTRTLRYYEEIDLISSTRKAGYAYRVYDEEAISRLQIILIFRKLSISLKDIQVILSSSDPEQFIALLNNKLSEVEQEMESLSNVKEVIQLFLHYVNEYQLLKYDIKALDVFNDELIIKKLHSTSLNPKMLKEKKTMKEVKKKIVESKVSNVRIIHIPSMTVASSHCEPCKEPESIAKGRLDEFMKSNDLCNLKPDFRVFGFDIPSQDDSGSHGYEFWVSIPEDLEVPEPLTKKTFAGGLYAAHSIKMGDFHEWKLFVEWMKASEAYDYDRREPLGMDGSLEEELNAFSNYTDNIKECSQLDLLIPVKKRT